MINREQVVPALKEKLGVKNIMAVPQIKKVILNVGLSQGLKDQEFIERVKSNLMKVTGQKPVERKSKKSISNFKIREGMVIGTIVTLRGKKMWDFLEKLIKISLPRVRDFRGLPATGFDKGGSYSFGLKEANCFPEMNQDEMEKLHGIQVTLTTTAKDKKAGFTLLQELGFPFKTDEK
jgi:large subunit ribosomal protein L5